MTCSRVSLALWLTCFASVVQAQAPEARTDPAGADATDEAPDPDTAPPPLEGGTSLDTPVPPPPTAATAPRAPSPAELGAIEATWEVYHRAAMAIAEGDRDRARELLRAVASRVDHPAATPARRLLERLESLERAGGVGPLSRERPSALSRGELVVWHTLGGASAGALLCALAECDHVRSWTLSMIGLGVVGGGVAYALSRDGVRPGRAALHGAALRWGYLDTWLLASVLGLTWKEVDWGPGDTELQYTNGHVVALLVGQGLGLAGALLADHFFAPSAGDVGLIDSLHNLSSATLTFFFAALDAFGFGSQADARRVLAPLLVSNALALGLGGWLTKKVEMTRGRSLLLDLGMVLGAGLGVGMPLLIAGDDVEPEMLVGGGAAGVVVGFTSAWIATRRMRPSGEDDAGNVDFAIAPTVGGAQASLQVRLR